MSVSIYRITYSSILTGLYSNIRNLARAVRLVWRSSRWWTVANLILVIIQGFFPLVSLYITKQIIEAVTPEVSISSTVFFQRILFWIGTAAFVAILTAAAQLFSDLSQQTLSMEVTDTVLDLLHAQSAAVDLSFYEDSSFYETLHRAQQEAPYRPSHILTSLVQLVRNILSAAGIFALLVSFHWAIGVLMLVIVLPGAVLRYSHSRRLFDFEQRQTEKERKAWYYHLMLIDSSFAKELRLFLLGPLFRDRFRQLRKDLRDGRIDLSRRKLLVDFAVQVFGSFVIFGVVAFAAYQALVGTYSLGGLVAIYLGFQTGLGFLQSILQNLAGLYEDGLFLSSFFEFLDLKHTVQPPAEPAPLLKHGKREIVFDHVSFSYPHSAQPVLQDINLRLASGEVIALVGENGSGKTTLVKLLCQLYVPHSGRVLVDGTDLKEHDPEQWRRKISVIFQDYAHYQLPAWENIWLGGIDREPDRTQIAATARLAGADTTIQRLPDGYDQMLGSWFDTGSEISTGEWQKIALARAFWREAEIVVLDEPTSSLDPLAEESFFNHFRQLIDHRSAVLISHRFSTVRMADRIYVLDQGKIVENGSHEELLQKNGLYARLYNAQAQYFQAASNPDHTKGSRAPEVVL